jgi:hypothetical protein
LGNNDSFEGERSRRLAIGCPGAFLRRRLGRGVIYLFAIAKHVSDSIAKIIELVAQLLELCIDAGELLVHVIEALIEGVKGFFVAIQAFVHVAELIEHHAREAIKICFATRVGV